MTRARALKQVIRARAAKTGERYTAARRHVMRELNDRRTTTAVAVRTPPAATPTDKRVKGAISDAASLKKTGHDLAHWYAVLDRFGAVKKGHTAAARHLRADHGVPGWYSQGITVSYERARGVRGVNQRCDGAWEVSVSKTIAATSAQLVKAFSDARRRGEWINEVDPQLAAALAKGLADKKSKGWVVRPDGLARCRYKWDDTIVQLYAYPKPNGKLALTVQHTRLANSAAVEQRRAEWKTAFGRLAAYFTA